MKDLIYRLVVICVCVATTHLSYADSCGSKGIAMQVLGSGGPELQDKRASSSYVIWQHGKARVLIDSGGGSALRFGQSGADFVDLDFVLFTHLHVDHSADFPALIKSSYFQDRKKTLPVFGPPGNETFPATSIFIKNLFADKQGAYAYLSDFIDPIAESNYRIEAHDISLDSKEIKTIFSNERLSVSATQVIHGGAPAVAFRIEVDGKSIVFSGDTNGINGNLEILAKNADLFVAHNAIPENATGPILRLHMTPSIIGAIAHTANVKQLIISHRMLRTLGRETETRNAIKKNYKGPIAFADDLSCFALR